MTGTKRKLTSVEICAGAGGQALGLHNALFKHLALIEIDPNAIATLKKNVEGNAEWEGCEVTQEDLTLLDPEEFRERLRLEPGQLDLLAGGVPCPPFSVAGKQLGREDERDLFPTMLKLVARAGAQGRDDRERPWSAGARREVPRVSDLDPVGA